MGIAQNFKCNTATVFTTTSTVVSMTSQEIADLVDKRHDNVKRTIESLVESDVISHPQFEDGTKSANGVVSKVYVFSGEQGKRDAMVLVAQLSPLFTGKLVDRWMELEKQVLSTPQLPNFLDPAEAAIAWASQYKAKQEVESKLLEVVEVLAVTQPKADVYDLIAAKVGSHAIRDAAKLLNMRPKDFTQWLIDNKWIYGSGATNYKPFSSHSNAGHLVLKHAVHCTQVRVTNKGMVLIAKRLNVVLKEDDFN